MLDGRKLVECLYGSDAALSKWAEQDYLSYIPNRLSSEFGLYIKIYFEHGIAEEIAIFNIDTMYDPSALLKVGANWLGEPSYKDGIGYYWVGDRRIHLISVFYTLDPRGSFVDIFAKVHKGRPVGLPWSLCRSAPQRSWCSVLAQ